MSELEKEFFRKIIGALERAADALETLARIAEEKNEPTYEELGAAYDTKKRT